MAINQTMRISVIIPAYNLKNYIGRAIESVLKQTRQADEIIVVDDGSTDGTAELVRLFGEQVRYFYQINSGVAEARNRGIAEAHGEWIAFLDGDDEWLENHLQCCASILKKHDDLIWCTGNYFRQAAGETIRRQDRKANTLKKVLGGNDFSEDYFEAYGRGAGGHTNTMVVRRQAILDVGGFRKIVSPAEDVDLWFRLALRYPKIGYVTEPTAVYYVERTGSLIDSQKTQLKLEVNQRVLLDTFQEAKRLGQTERFKPAGLRMARLQIRGYLFEKTLAKDVKMFLESVSFLLPRWYVWLVRGAVRMPTATAWALHMISKVVRKLHLRHRIVPRPRR